METIVHLLATSGIVGSLQPWVQALVQQPHWSSRAKAILQAVFAVVLGSLTALTTGDLTGLDWSSTGTWIAAVGIVFAASKISFETLSRTTALTPAEQLGAKTITPAVTDIDIPADDVTVKIAALEARITALEPVDRAVSPAVVASAAEHAASVAAAAAEAVASESKEA